MTVVAGIIVSFVFLATKTISPPLTKIFTVDLGDATTALATPLPADPTTNPTDPYDPQPLRVGTIGAAVYHRPFCPFAKRAIGLHGLENRINFWTREQVANSGRVADSYCMSSVFDCSTVTPIEFATAGNDPFCGANIDRRYYDVSGVDATIAGKTLCKLQGYIGVFVDDPSNCKNGVIVGSSTSCDQAACSACTQNCDTAPECVGCVKVTMAILNKLALGKGDATGDGQEDIDDYLYYHECYSGENVSATMPCVNVFDWDDDGDVDVDDYANFVFSYDSGNKNWAIATFPQASFPDTSINPPRLELPLRVGTEGSQYYHRLDCPSVNNSWATWGADRRMDFYSWDQVEGTTRIPDTIVCLPGVRANPSGTWQD